MRNHNVFQEALYHFPFKENNQGYTYEYFSGTSHHYQYSNSDHINQSPNYYGESSNALRHHSSNSCRVFSIDKRFIPIGEKSIRFKIKSYNNSVYSWRGGILSEAPLFYAEGHYGLISYVAENTMFIHFALIKDGIELFNVNTGVPFTDNKWHDVLFTWNGATTNNGVKLYYDGKLVDMGRAEDTESNVSSLSTYLGRHHTISQSSSLFYMNDLEIYDKVIEPHYDRVLILDDGTYKYHDGTAWVSVLGTEQDFRDYGMISLDHINEAQWGFISENAEVHIWTSDTSRTHAYVEFNVEPYTIDLDLGEVYTAKTLLQADLPNGVVYDESLPVFNLYSILGDDIVLHINNPDETDVKVNTQIQTTDIYEMYDEIEVFTLVTDEQKALTGDEVYTTVNARYTPLDLFEEDYEVVSVYDKNSSSIISIEAIPAPQFTKLISPKKVYGYLNEVKPVDLSRGYREDLRFVFGNETATKWYVWSTLHNRFIQVTINNEKEILANGMKASQVQAITEEQWRTWTEEYVNIGIYLKNNPRGTIVSEVGEISYTDYLPRFASTLKSGDFKIINTTAHLDMTINGTTIKGYLDDVDGGKTQYRVLVNNNVYYPEGGEFTELLEGEQQVHLTINSEVLTIGDWNNVKIEFKDSFGTVEYWSTNFIGTYTGLMFKDVYGSYYTTDMGELLQYLDFGVIVAGQTTLEHEIILKNQYGYDVKNLHLYPKYVELPSALEIQFSKKSAPFQAESELKYDGVTLENNEEMSFFIRLKTELGSTPNANGEFAIVVRADKVEET